MQKYLVLHAIALFLAIILFILSLAGIFHMVTSWAREPLEISSVFKLLDK